MWLFYTAAYNMNVDSRVLLTKERDELEFEKTGMNLQIEKKLVLQPQLVASLTVRKSCCVLMDVILES